MRFLRLWFDSYEYMYIDDVTVDAINEDPNTYTDIAAGPDVACGVVDLGEIFCWGNDSSGQVSDSPTGTGFTAVDVGHQHACALDSMGAITCWGDDTASQVASTPTATGFTEISAGAEHTCALGSTGIITCWGDDTEGQITDAPTDDGYTLVTAGDYHTCAMDATNAISCWGDDTAGQATPPTLPAASPANFSIEHTFTGLSTSNEKFITTTFGDFTGNGFVDLAIGSPMESHVRPIPRVRKQCWKNISV